LHVQRLALNRGLTKTAVLGRLLRDGRTREDLLDVAVSLERARETSIPYEKVRALMLNELRDHAVGEETH
jgi:hypothetical protein